MFPWAPWLPFRGATRLSSRRDLHRFQSWPAPEGERPWDIGAGGAVQVQVIGEKKNPVDVMAESEHSARPVERGERSASAVSQACGALSL